MYLQQKPIPGYWYSNLSGQLLQVRAMVLTDGVLFAAGHPDVLDADGPPRGPAEGYGIRVRGWQRELQVPVGLLQSHRHRDVRQRVAAEVDEAGVGVERLGVDLQYIGEQPVQVRGLRLIARSRQLPDGLVIGFTGGQQRSEGRTLHRMWLL